MNDFIIFDQYEEKIRITIEYGLKNGMRPNMHTAPKWARDYILAHGVPSLNGSTSVLEQTVQEELPKRRGRPRKVKSHRSKGANYADYEMGSPEPTGEGEPD